MTERLYYPGEIAKMTHTLTAGEIRAACHRDPMSNRLPHIESGSKRPTIKIAMSDYEAWLEREKVR